MSARLLLDTFQKYLVISVVFGLSICTATTNPSSFGNGIVLLGCFFVVRVGENCNKNVLLRVTEEKMKIYSYIRVGKNSVSAGCFVKAGLISSACIIENI
jgi:hypothetical protein